MNIKKNIKNINKYVIKMLLVTLIIVLPMTNTLIDVFAAELGVLKITELSAYQTGPSTDSSSKATLHVRNDATGQEIDDRLALLMLEGEEVYCIEPFVKTKHGYEYAASSETLESILGSIQSQRRIGLLSYYGYGYNGDSTLLAYGATQIAIWEWQGNTVSNITQEMRNKVEEIKQRATNKITDNKPSFNNTNIVLSGYGKENAITLTDTKGLFHDYYFTSSDFQYERNGDTLKIWTDKYIEKGTIQFQLINPDDENRLGDSIVFINPGNAQKVSKIRYKDPMAINVNVSVALGKLELAKKDNKGNFVANTSFMISYNADMSNPIGTYKTGTNGKVTISNLEPKKVYIQETAVPSHLILNDTVGSIDVIGDTTTSYTFTNNWKQGYIQVTKYDSKTGQVVKKQGAQFEIVKNGKVVETMTTSSNGIAKSGLLDYGQYLVREKTAPANYTVTSVTQNTSIIENGHTYSQNFMNTPVTGTIDLQKVDVETTTSQGDATLQGASYVLKAKDAITNPADASVLFSKDETISIKAVGNSTWGDTGTKSTDKDGKIQWKNLPMGNYYIQEKTPSTGYLLSKTMYPVTIASTSQNTSIENRKVTVTEQVEKGKIQITKVGTDGETNNVIPALSGVEFTVKLYNEVKKVGWDNAKVVDRITTASNGIAVTKDLPYGNYIIKETKTPASYTPSGDFFVNIDKDKEIEYRVVNNIPFKAWLKIVKTNEEKERVTLNSATFKVKDKNGNYLQQKVGGKYVDTWTTNEEGYVVLDTMLLPDEYTIVEIESPEGLLMGKEIKIKIDSSMDLEFDEDNQPVVTVAYVNETPKGKIILHKEFERTEDTAIGGAIFKLTANEDISSPVDGRTLYSKGDAIDIDGMHPEGLYTVGESGKLEIANLPLGITGASYTLEEVKTLDGYKVLEEKIIYEFEIKDTVTKEYQIEKTVENKLTTTYFSKQDMDGKPLEGARVSILDVNGDSIDSWISDGSEHLIKGLVYGKEYIWREDASPLGYAIAKEIVFTYAPELEGKSMIMQDKYVEVEKVDVYDEAIVGAKLQVISTKTKQIVDEWLTDGKGHRIENLVEGGEYILQEIETPAGKVTALPIRFTVTKENQALTMVDKQVKILKQDKEGKKIKGAKLEIIDIETKEVVDEWISDESVHLANHLIVGKTYVVSEAEAPEGYVKAKDIEFTVEDDKQVQEISMVDKQVAILKKDSEGSLIKGAKLQIKEAKTEEIVDEWISDGNFHLANHLEVGKEYIVSEVEAPAGYAKAKDIEFTVSDEEELQIVMMTDKQVAIAKRDVEGQYVKGAKLQIKDKETDKVVEEWTTKDTLHFASHLEVEKIYIVSEVEAPAGYVKAKDIEFTVNDDQELQTVMMTDKQIAIAKRDIAGQYVKGAKLQIKDKETDKVVEEWTTKDTLHFANHLEVEKTYIVSEVEAPEGYVKAKDIEFTVSKGEEVQNIVMTDKQVAVAKRDVEGQYVKGAKLQIKDKETNEVVDEWTTKNTTHLARNLEVEKTYIISEIEVPEGYIKAKDIEFTVNNVIEEQEITMTDERILTDIQINKLDSETKNPILSLDFEFSMYEDEKCTKELAKVSANKEEGTVTFEDIEYGQTVYIKETKQPEGYRLSNEVVKVTLDMELEGIGNVHRIEYVNEKEPVIQVATADRSPIESVSILCVSSLVASLSLTAVKRKKSKRNK